ncbi:MAG: ABC transporter permease [Acidimicrobiia bacterium]|nr:ABC transporter permease [Acidimicrobiia bacterium]
MVESLRQRLPALLGHPVTLALVLAFGVSGVVIALTGGAPFIAFSEMLLGGFTGSGLRATLGRSIPIVGMALAFSLCFRAGILNLGGEGQMLVGALAGTMTTILVPGPGLLVVPLALVVGAVVGGLWALLPALGQTELQVPLLITSLLLNYVARSLNSYLVRYPFGEEGAAFASTVAVPETARIPKIEMLGGGVSISLLFVLGLVVFLSYLFGRSIFGYETKMAGISGPFARYGGVDVRRHTLVIMAAAGAIGGLVGTHLVVGETFRYVDADMLSQTGFAWTGLMVALLAFNRPVPILVAGLFFAGLQIGGFAMERHTDVSWQLAEVIQALVIVAVVSRLAIRWRRDRLDRVGPATLRGESDVDQAHVGEV